MDTEKILAICDHTLLKPEATWDQIRELLDDAIRFRTASVCIPPCYVRPAAEYADGRMKICTVIGFPNGNMSTRTKVYETKDAIADGADEIDMVINIGRLKGGDTGYVADEIRQIKDACGEHILKVIIETCLLTDEEKISMCRIVTQTGADYIKTSTGFSTAGATFEDIKLFAEHVGKGVGIKAAGGISTLEDAKKFMELGATRLGTSRVVKIVKETGGGSVGKPTAEPTEGFRVNDKENITDDTREDRLDRLIEELTIDEKLKMLSSGSDAPDRLGYGSCYLGGEAAHGVEARNDQNGLGDPDVTTSFPQPVGMSSSWDRELICKAGNVVGREARAVYSKRKRGGLSRWAPTVDLLRDPRWGRNEEAYGEDPVQVGGMASAYIRGMQGDDPEHLLCAATLKHFYANNTEIGRGWKNSSISPRNKYELYLEPFRRAIEDGGAEGIMTSYNRINGVQGMFNGEVQHILKDEYGLGHAVCDGAAMNLTTPYSHSTGMDAEAIAISLKAGVDAMSSHPANVNAAAREAYELGLISEEDIDRAIRNTWRTRFKLGVYDDKPSNDYVDITYDELCSEEASQICRELTDESIVLLKNDGILPLGGTGSESAVPGGEGRTADAVGLPDDMVLIGPLGDKWYQDWYGGCAPCHETVLDGFGGKPHYVDGLDRVQIECGGRYLGIGDDDRLVMCDEPGTFIMEDWGEGSYTFRCERTGKYLTTHLGGETVEGVAGGVAGSSDSDGVTGRVFADADRIFSWFDLEVFRIEHGKDCQEGEVILKNRFGHILCADDKDRIYVKIADEESKDGVQAAGSDGEACSEDGRIRVRINIVQNGIDEAIRAAAGSGTVIMSLGCHPMINAKEEIDRSTIEFIPYQQKLFDEVIKVNPNVVVVLLSNYPYAINGINEKARAVIWSATGSQCMGGAIADVLTGRTHPAGRLTQTWYKSDDDLPDIDDYDIIGGCRTYRYFEGEALYPFGYGLTYTDFGYEGLKARIDGSFDGGSMEEDGRIIQAELILSNTGEARSDEVVQIYMKAPGTRVKRPDRQLVAFERVKGMDPGEKRTVSFDIPIRELAYYDVISESMIVEEGNYEIWAGPSSADLRVSAQVFVEGIKTGLRDMRRMIRADHYDEESGSQIVEGMYGYNALMAKSDSVYEPDAGGRFEVTYRDCDISGDASKLCLHCYAPKSAGVMVYIDEQPAGELEFDTAAGPGYEPPRNRMPRALRDEEGRRASFPVNWTKVEIPVNSSRGRTLRIVVDGGLKFDWFRMV